MLVSDGDKPKVLDVAHNRNMLETSFLNERNI